MSQIDFIQIYADYKENVWKLVSRYVSPQQDKEDLFQEVFLKIHKALPKFRGEASLLTWIYRITVNTALNYLKKQKRYKMIKDVFSNLRIVEADESEEAGEDLLLKPLEKLNPRQKMVLILSDVEEKKLGQFR